MSVLDRIGSIRAEAEAAVAGAPSSAALEELRVRYLGRKAELPNLLRGVAQLPPEERGTVGRAANQARQALEALIEARAQRARAPPSSTRASRRTASTSRCPASRRSRSAACTSSPRPGARSRTSSSASASRASRGRRSTSSTTTSTRSTTTSRTRRATHTDTFYVAPDVVLRTHTSPMQVRAMEAHPPPLYVVIPGRTYRRDSDATHTPQFHQVEGLAVDEDITLADLKGTLLSFANAIFGEGRDVRLRPHFFPFTEPSVEVDVSCFNCDGTGFLSDGSRCRLCKGEGWIEILGAGEVDPNVYSYVDDDRYDPEKVQGFAWGMGIERIAQLKHGVTGHARALRQRPPLPGAVRLMRAPIEWLLRATRTPGSPRGSSRSA